MQDNNFYFNYLFFKKFFPFKIELLDEKQYLQCKIYAENDKMRRNFRVC